MYNLFPNEAAGAYVGEPDKLAANTGYSNHGERANGRRQYGAGLK